jgi:hypothetical protein
MLAANDAYTRLSHLAIATANGLRAGTYDADQALTKITLNQWKWTNDLAVSGPVEPDSVSGFLTATLTLSGLATGTLRAVWDPTGPQGDATVIGVIDGASLEFGVFDPGTCACPCPIPAVP